MILQILLFGAGLVTLILGAGILVRGASQLASAAGISPLVVGLTVVAFGTSAPEAAVSVGAVLSGQGEIAIGNVIGSNIFNLLVILGISAILIPLVVDLQVIRQEVPILLGASILVAVLALDGRLGRLDGVLLFGLVIVYTVFLVRQSRAEIAARTADGVAAQTRAAVAEEKGEAETGRNTSAPGLAQHWVWQAVQIAVGLALLVLGAHWLVSAASAFARLLGIAEVIIGLTIVAAGTSLPEVATSVVAALRGERDIAVGNAVGSCIFNLFACLGLAALVGPQALVIPESVLRFDLWVMLAVTLACLPVFISGHRIDRWEGFVFLGYYLAYTAYLILQAQRHEALPAFSGAMMGFVLPITVVTFVIVMLRQMPSRS